MYSRSRATGWSNGAEKRRTTCALTWVPSPSTNRPRPSSARSHAAWAVTIGLRGKATAIPVPTRGCSVAARAAALDRNGLCRVSVSQMASNPASAARRPSSPACDSGTPAGK